MLDGKQKKELLPAQHMPRVSLGKTRCHVVAGHDCLEVYCKHKSYFMHQQQQTSVQCKNQTNIYKIISMISWLVCNCNFLQTHYMLHHVYIVLSGRTTTKATWRPNKNVTALARHAVSAARPPMRPVACLAAADRPRAWPACPSTGSITDNRHQ